MDKEEGPEAYEHAQRLLTAKHDAHAHYEIVRSELPKLCKASGVEGGTAEKLEAYIIGRLNASALDGAVAALSAKAEGLFLCAPPMRPTELPNGAPHARNGRGAG